MAKRRKGGTGKVKHKNKLAALIVAKKMKNRQLNVYCCLHCGGWHIGTSGNPYRKQQRLTQLLGR